MTINIFESKLLRNLSERTNKDMKTTVLKLGEEVGEIIQALFNYLGDMKSTTVEKINQSSNVRLDFIEEVIDAQIVTQDILNNLDTTREEYDRIMNKKLNKWSKHYIK